jgi:hypothetical protein
VVCQSIDRMCATSCLHMLDYSITRLRAPLHRAHIANRGDYRTAAPAFGGPAFLPTASGGVSSRNLS